MPCTLAHGDVTGPGADFISLAFFLNHLVNHEE